MLGQAAMALTPEEKRAWVDSHVSADLKFIFNECGLHGDLQYDVSQFYKTTMRFGAIADSRGGLREAMQQESQVAVDTPAGRARMSAAVSAWETAKQVSDEDIKLLTESKNLGICRPLPQSDRSAMIRAIEVARGRSCLTKRLPPTSTYHSFWKWWSRTIWKAESSALQLQTSLDQAGRLRVSRQRPKGKLPQTTEELRRKLRIEANTWMMMASKMKNKPYLQNLELQHFDRFVDYLLGDRCYNLHVVSFTGDRVPLKPHWHVLLTYEYELRKRAIKDAYKKQLSLGVTLKQVCADAELKELYFTSQIALNKDKELHDRPEKFQKFGFGKGSSPGKSSKSFGKGNKGQSTLPGTNFAAGFKDTRWQGDMHPLQHEGTEVRRSMQTFACLSCAELPQSPSCILA